MPKDGPSAGIAITTAIVSALTGAPVRRDVAMTGEITIRGRVLPIGGLREKTMAAFRNGIHTVIIPEENRKDLEEIDQTVRQGLHFLTVSKAAEVLAEALLPVEEREAETKETKSEMSGEDTGSAPAPRHSGGRPHPYLPVNERAHMNIQNTEFVISAAKKSDFPRDHLPQVVFAGRLNVGKSSVINCLLGRKNFARVGNSPGKTTHINYFLVDRQLYLVDLPGYGYAKVSQAERARWGRLIEQWFQDPSLMTLGVQIVDARHKPTADDCTMIECFKQSGKPYIVVANKLDKLKKSEIEPNLLQIRNTLQIDESVKVIPFSAEKKIGREELLSLVTGESFAEDGK